MIINKFNGIVFGLILVPVLVFPQSFTKPKVPSSNKLKESCGQEAGLLLKEIPTIMHACAEIQHNAVDFLEDLLEGECALTRPQLEGRQQKLAAFNKKMEQWAAEMRAFAGELKQGM